MPGGRAQSARSDTSDIEQHVETMMELKKLERSYRIMEKDRKAYTQESQQHINRQRRELTTLEREQEEILKDLRLIESQSNQKKNDNNCEQLEALARLKQNIEDMIEEERKRADEMKSEVREWERKNKDQNKNMGGVHMSAQHHVQTVKNVRKLNNSLELATNNFCRKLETNRKLREEIDSLRVERQRFDGMFKRMDRDLQRLKQEIGQVIDESTAAYDSRDEAQAKMILLKEKADKDLQSYNTEMKELLRIIAHEKKLRDFMKIKDRELQEEPQLVEWRKKKEAKEAEKKKANQSDSVETYEDAYKRIKEITGEEDMTLIVEKFIEVEDRNFALFNFVNEQNNEIEMLQEQIQDVKDEIEQFKAQGVDLEEQRQQILKSLEEKQARASREADDYNEKHTAVMKILDQLRAGIDSLFSKINCDKDSIDDMLGTNQGVTDQNLLQYLGVIEERTNDLLLTQAYVNSQKDFEDYARRQPSLLGEGPQPTTTGPAIMPPAVGDDYDSEGSEASADDDRPFNRDELMNRALKSVKKRESIARKEGFKYDLSEATTKKKDGKGGKR